MYSQDIEQAGIQLRFFENLDHQQEITECEILLEPILAGPQIRPVLQHAQRLATSVSGKHPEPGGL